MIYSFLFYLCSVEVNWKKKIGNSLKKTITAPPRFGPTFIKTPSILKQANTRCVYTIRKSLKYVREEMMLIDQRPGSFSSQMSWQTSQRNFRAPDTLKLRRLFFFNLSIALMHSNVNDLTTVSSILFLWSTCLITKSPSLSCLQHPTKMSSVIIF